MTTWYSPLRTRKSLGSQSARPGSLAGLHAARRENLAQFFTPDAVAALMWRLAAPAMDAALTAHPGGKVALIDTSVGTGRLLQYAEPDKHILAGADVHAPSVAAFASAAEAAGFEVDLVCAGLETLKPKGFGCALLNPPFSIHLDSPLLQPLPGNAFGRFGPASAAVSHVYAVEQALRAADCVLAILPRTASAIWRDDPERHDRLRAVLTLPPRSFEAEGTDVAVDLVVFGPARDPRAPWLQTLSALDEAVPPLALSCRTTVERRPRPLSETTVDVSRPAFRQPVTGDRRVRVTHAGRRLNLTFACALVEAKCRNAVLERPVNRPSDTHRYPKGVAFKGQGIYDLELYLLQSDPLAAFEGTLNRLRELGAEPDVDPGVRNYLRKAVRRAKRERTPFRHVVRGVAAAGTERALCAIPRAARLVDANQWGSPIFQPGTEYAVRCAGGEFTVTHPATPVALTLDEAAFRAAFELRGDDADAAEWQVVHEGRVAAFPQLAQTHRAQMERAGITAWLDRDYQQHDVIEMRMGRGGTIAWLMSLGKSRAALALALLGGDHSLVVLEPQLVAEFRREIEKVGLPRSLWQVISRPQHCEALKRINIISLNRLKMEICAGAGRRTYASRLRRRIGTLVADEAEVLANPHSQQSRALEMVSPRRRYTMSGTPARSRPRDLLGITGYSCGDGTALQPFGKHHPYAAPFLLRNMDYATPGAVEFMGRHVVLEWVSHEFIHSGLRTGAKREVPKVRGLAQLRDYAAPLLKRRTLEEPEVARYITVPTPEKIYTTLGWDDAHLGTFLDRADRFAEMYKRARAEATGRGTGLNLIALLARVGAVVRAGNCPQFPTPDFKPYGPHTSKQRYLIERMEQLARDGHKTVCLVDQPMQVELLVRALAARGCEAVPFHGGIPIARRVRDMDNRFRFGEAPTLVATLETLESGYNLPQANYALFGARSWVARTEAQALARLLRGEQTRDVTAEYVHLAGSMDEYMAQVVAMKADSLDATIDFLVPQLQDEEFHHMDAIIDRFVIALAERRGFDRPYDFREHLKHAA